MSTSLTDRRNVPLARAVAEDGRPKYLIAAGVPMPANVFGGILSGRVRPTAHQRERLAAVLNRTESELFGETS
jgi:hypothetical protein